MLRYKNSLLERVLLEKGRSYLIGTLALHALIHIPPSGIDVQAELRAKTGSPNLGPTRAPASAHPSPNQAPLQQRAILNRQQQRRSLQGPPKADGSNGLPMIQPDGPVQRSPLSQPTPGSHLSSPAQSATRSPNFVAHGQAHGQSVSPNFGALPPQQLRPQPPRNNFTPMMGAQRPPLAANQQNPGGLPNASTVGHSVNGMTQSSGPSAFYPSQYSDHMNQLGKLPHLLRPCLSPDWRAEQEYDEQAEKYDDEEPSDQSAGPGPFPQQNFTPTNNMPPPMPPAQNPPYTSPATLPQNDGGHAFNPNMNQLFDPYDPMLDADPFGLSASMHFPTLYESR
jgi:hypothetical protein